MNQIDHLPESPVDPRVRFAADLTMQAWIRTGLAMMGFGFIVARFGLFLREFQESTHIPVTESHNTSVAVWVGTALVGLGVVINILASIQHSRFLDRFTRGEAYQPPRWSLEIVTSLLVAAIGLGMAVYLLISGF